MGCGASKSPPASATHPVEYATTVTASASATVTAPKIPAEVTTQRSRACALSRKASTKATGSSVEHDPELHALVNRWLSALPTLVVFDWDLTVVSVHTFREGVAPEAVAGRWEADMCDLELFREFTRAANVRGIGVGIASYGRRDVIIAYLHCIFGEGELPLPLSMIVTPQDFDLPDGTPLPVPGKPKMLACLCERASPAILDPSAVLFFEDDEVNVDDAHDAGYEMSIFVPEGFSRSSLVAAETGDTFDPHQAGAAFSAAWGMDPDDPNFVAPPERRVPQ